MDLKGTYIAFDVKGLTDKVCSNYHTFQQLQSWQKNHPNRFNFINMQDIVFAAEHDELLDSTLKSRFLKEMATADNLLVITSPVLNTESELLNWQISRAVNRFHLPVIIAYAGLEHVDEHTIEEYWTWLPAKFKKYITRYSWAQMAHIPLTQDKLERALRTFSASRQSYPWDATSIF